MILIRAQLRMFAKISNVLERRIKISHLLAAVLVAAPPRYENASHLNFLSA